MIDLTKVRNYYIACGYTDLRLGYIESVFFCDTLPRDALLLSNSTTNHNLSHHIGLSKDSGKANLYCTFYMLYTLIRQTTEVPSFDDAIMAISRELISFQ